MANADLKKQLISYIDTADERLLKLIQALVETYQQNEPGSYDEIPDEHKKILDRRLEEHEKNPADGKEWAALKSDWRTKYGA